MKGKTVITSIGGVKYTEFDKIYQPALKTCTDGINIYSDFTLLHVQDGKVIKCKLAISKIEDQVNVLGGDPYVIRNIYVSEKQ